MNRPNLNSKCESSKKAGESSKTDGSIADWMTLTAISVPWWFHEHSHYPDYK